MVHAFGRLLALYLVGKTEKKGVSEIGKKMSERIQLFLNN